MTLSTSTPIEITSAAAQRLDRVLGEEETEKGSRPALRVAIRGGGCSGFQYDFQLIKPDEKEDDDFLITAQDVSQPDMNFSVIIDPISMQYLAGSKLDFVSTLTEQRFVFQNPNASAHCGCGSSFAA